MMVRCAGQEYLTTPQVPQLSQPVPYSYLNIHVRIQVQDAFETFIENLYQLSEKYHIDFNRVLNLCVNVYHTNNEPLNINANGFYVVLRLDMIVTEHGTIINSPQEFTVKDIVERVRFELEEEYNYVAYCLKHNVDLLRNQVIRR